MNQNIRVPKRANKNKEYMTIIVFFILVMKIYTWNEMNMELLIKYIILLCKLNEAIHHYANPWTIWHFLWWLSIWYIYGCELVTVRVFMSFWLGFFFPPTVICHFPLTIHMTGCIFFPSKQNKSARCHGHFQKKMNMWS